MTDDEAPRSARPLHRQPVALGLVLVGGAAGTGVRDALSLARPGGDGLPVTIGAINLAGALLLGLLLESLARRGPDVGRRRTLRLLLGTGFVGGFTTYSTLATDCARLLREGHPGVAVGYGVGTVVLGAVCTMLGVVMGVALTRPRGEV